MTYVLKGIMYLSEMTDYKPAMLYFLRKTIRASEFWNRNVNVEVTMWRPLEEIVLISTELIALEAL